MMNVKKYTKAFPELSHKLAYKHVYRIHYARDNFDVCQRVYEATEAWKKDPKCAGILDIFTSQWLQGRFTLWQCMSSPHGFAKTNNPAEQFNKDLKRDYTLRGLVSVYALAQLFQALCHHRSIRVSLYSYTPAPTSDQLKRYSVLMATERLSVSPSYRSSIMFLTGQVLNVFQSGTYVCLLRPSYSVAKVHDEEMKYREKIMEHAQQPSFGWTVNTDNGTCGCGSWLKMGYCVQVIAAGSISALR